MFAGKRKTRLGYIGTVSRHKDSCKGNLQRNLETEDMWFLAWKHGGP